MQGGPNNFKYQLIYVLDYGNISLIKYIQDIKPALSHSHRLMINFLHGPKILLKS